MNAKREESDKLRNYAGLFVAKQELDAQIKKINAQMAEIEKELLPDFIDGGVQRITVDGQTVWLDRKIRASAGGDVPALAAALEADGEEWLISKAVNNNTLSAWVREKFDPDKMNSPDEVKAQMPPNVRAAITVSEVYKLRVKRGD